jgi:hypothetical protein
MVLKKPVTNACEKAGLQGCEPLSEGVIMYVEGDKATAVPRIQQAAAQNSPQQLKAFADAIVLLEKVPGASGYAQPLVEVAKILSAQQPGADGAGSGTTPITSDSSAHAATGGTATISVSSAGKSRAEAVYSVTADVDPASIDGGMIRLSQSRKFESCGNRAPEGWKCFELVEGPFVATDLRSTGDCSIFVASGRPTDKQDDLRWVMHAPFEAHGSRLAAEDDEVLFMAVAGTDVPDEHNPYEKSGGKGPECTVLWAGFYPY